MKSIAAAGEAPRSWVFASKAALFHLSLALIAAATVEEIPKPGWAAALASLLYYGSTIAATQVPHLVFLSPSLGRESERLVLHSKLGFYGRCFIFWLFIGSVLFIQLAVGMQDESKLAHAFARWALLLGLIAVFSALDFAIPSYRRYMKLALDRRWGPRARVISND